MDPEISGENPALCQAKGKEELLFNIDSLPPGTVGNSTADSCDINKITK